MSIRRKYDFIRIFQVEISNTLALDEGGGIRKFLVFFYCFGTRLSNAWCVIEIRKYGENV